MSRIKIHRLKSIGMLLSSNVAAAGVIAGGTLMVSRLVTPEAFGHYSYASQIALTVYPALTLRFEQALPLLGKQRRAGKYVLLGSLGLSFVNSLVLILLGLLLLNFVTELLSLAPVSKDMVLLVGLMAFSLSLSGIFQSASLMLGKLSRMAVARVLRAVTMVVLQLLLVLAISGGATWLMVAEFSASLMQALMLAGGIGMASIWRLIRQPSGQLISRLWVLAKRHKAFPMISLPHLLAHSSLGIVLTSVFNGYYGAAALGQYYLVRKLIFGVLAMFGTAIYQQAIAESAQVQRKDVYFVARRALFLSAAASFTVAVAVMLFGPQLFKFTAGEKWSLAGQMTIALLPLILMEPITSTFAFVPVFLGLQKIAMGVAVLQGCLGVAAIFVAGSLGWSALQALTLSSIAMSATMAGYVWWLLRHAKRVARLGVYE